MHPTLERLIQTAGMALEAEDRYMLGAVTANQIAYDGESGGILRINNERYYQFIVARALMSSMPYKVKVEVDTHDLLLEAPKTGERIAVIEMKRWMSSTGEKEISGIRRDLFEKLPSAKAELKLMLIFSANPPNQMQKQISWLSEKLDIPTDKWKTHSFATVNEAGLPFEYWTAGYQVG
jgi:predicted AAA+ superfamily ATPase